MTCNNCRISCTRFAALGILAGVLICVTPVLSVRAAGEQEYKQGIELYKKNERANAYAKWKQAATLGHVRAMFYMGNGYHRGDGLKQDFVQAATWYRKAAAGGDSDAMSGLGVLYQTGQGVKKDHTQALDWYRQAAGRGNTNAMYNIGLMYFQGSGVTKDYEKTLKWYKQAAAKGHANAMFGIGALHANGLGVSKDTAKAFDWARKAAEAGHPKAPYNVAWHYLSGTGVDRDDKKALAWLQKSAKAGDIRAVRELGYTLYDGRGVERDLEAALRFFRKTQKFKPDAFIAMRIWLCLQQLGKAREAGILLEQFERKNKPKGWQANLLQFLAGKITEAKLLESAQSDDAQKQSGQLCEAHFFVGSVKLIGGDKAAAITHFEKCIATDRTEFAEYRSANAELSRLKK